MKKNYLIFILFMLTPVYIWAQHVSSEQAAHTAAQFYKEINVGRPGTRTTTSPQLAHDAGSYYAFNLGNTDGYVIVAGDERLRSVLGYAQTGTFDYNALPPTMKSWLQQYAELIDELNKKNITVTTRSTATNATTRASQEVVIPTAKWGQGYPYNLQTPENSPAGCVATAMSIIMKHHRWPERGTGSHSYQWNGKTISANFDVAYDWDNMLMQYTDGSANEAQKQAVAQLMQHCGISIESVYGPTETGSYPFLVYQAWKEYFGYDKQMRSVLRNNVPKSHWMQLIKTEIDNNRPVLYSGRSSISGHAFVCDGYNDEGYIHINWGWDGYCDNFFLVDALVPEIDNPSISYSSDSEIIIGIRKAQAQETVYSDLWMNALDKGRGMRISVENIEKNVSFTIKATTLQNLSDNAFDGFVGVALTQKDRTITEIVGSATFALAAGAKAPELELNCKVQTANIAPTDLLYLVSSADNKQSWQIIDGQAVISFLPVVGNTPYKDVPSGEVGYDEHGNIIVLPSRLKEVILPKDFPNIEELTLIGEINADDIFYIRDNLRSYLKRIDMSRVKIVASDEYEANVLPREAFVHFWNLESINLPTNLEVIQSSAFDGVISLTSIELPATVRQIYGNAFYKTGITGVFKLPDNLEPIPYPYTMSFPHNKFTAFSISEENPYFSVVDGVLFNKNQTTLISYAGSGENVNYTVPASVTEINPNTFEGATLNSLDISKCNGLTEISNFWVFRECNIGSIYFPKTIQKIHENTFGSEWAKTTIGMMHFSGEPPVVNGASFTCNSVLQNTILVVAPGSINAWRKIAAWNGFANYLESDAMLSIFSNPRIFVKDETYILSGSLANISGSNMENVSLTLTCNGSMQQQLTLPGGAQHGKRTSFSLDPIDVPQGTTLTYTLTAKAGSIEKSIEGLIIHPERYYPRKFFGEWFVAQWCGWSVRAYKIQDELKAFIPDLYVGAIVMGEGPMAMPEYAKFLGFESTPTDFYNRIDKNLALWNNHECPFQISLAADNSENGKIKTTVKTTFSYSSPAESYRYMVILTEDGISSTEAAYDQNNFYSGGGSGEMGGYENRPSTLTNGSMIYNHIARYISDFEGLKGSVPTQIEAGKEYLFEHTIDIPSTVLNTGNLNVIVALIDASNGTVVACQNTTPGKQYAPSKRIFINEVTTGSDCWIELYNDEDTEVDLSEYRLYRSGFSGPLRMLLTIPQGTKIPAKGHCTLSGIIGGEEPYLEGLKINPRGGTEFILYNNTGNLLDYLRLFPQHQIQKGQSIGRETDGAPTLVIFDTPTPEAANRDLTSIQPGEEEREAGLIIYPNPARDWVNINLSGMTGSVTINVYNSQGMLCRTNKVEGGNVYPLNIEGLSPGIYLLRVNDRVGKLIIKQ